MAPERPVVPLQRACRSNRTTRLPLPPCLAREWAMLAPMTPPPMMRISAVSDMLIYSPFLLPDCVVVAAAEALAGRMGATRYCEIEVWYFAAFSLSGDVRNCKVGLFSPGGYSKRNGRPN